MTSVRNWVAFALTTAALTPVSLPARADEAGCLLIAAWAEARGEPLPVVEAVVSTILNRARTRGKSVCDAVMDPAAFSGVTPAMHELFVEASKPRANGSAIAQPHTNHDRAQLAAVEAIAAAALAGQLEDRSNGATHFYSPSGMRELGIKSDPDWAASMVRTATLGPFVFLREKSFPLQLEASNLPPALSIVTWGDTKSDSAPSAGMALTTLDAIPSLALAPEGEMIDFGTIDIIAQAKPPAPIVAVELASRPAPNFLAPLGEAFSAAATGRIEAAHSDLAPGDILGEIPLESASDVAAVEDDQIVLETWNSAPSMRHVKPHGEILFSFNPIQPLALTEEAEDAPAVADALPDDHASDRTDLADAGETQAVQSADIGEPSADTDEPARLAEVAPQSILPEADQAASPYARPLPSPRKPLYGRAAARPWSSPDEQNDARVAVAETDDDAPPQRTEPILKLWSPEPGTVLICRGRYLGAILTTLHGTRVPKRVVHEIRCNG